MAEPAPAPSARAWVGAAPFPWPAVEDVDEGDVLVGCYAVAGAQLKRTKHGKPYLELQLTDRHGVVEARVWEDASRLEPVARQGRFVGVRARVETFRDLRQLKIEALSPLAIESGELALFMPASARSPEEMDAELRGLVASVADAPLRRLLERLLGPDTETGRLFRRAPAAKIHHHAYVGGLLEHTLSIAGVCERLAAHYGSVVDRDLLMAGALLHDIGKIREISLQPGFSYTDEGKLLGHIVIGLDMVRQAAARVPELEEEHLLLLLHLIASHQGRYEWQSPREPRILEALILHYADDLDAKMRQAMDLLEQVDGGWTPYDRSLGREMLRHGRRGAAGERGDDAARPDPDALDLFGAGPASED